MMVISKDLKSGVCSTIFNHYQPPTVSLFLTSLVQQRVSSSVLEAFYYSINWIHSQASCINPCEEKFLKLTLEGGKRILAKPVNKKEPITIDILLKLKEEYQKDPD